MHVPFIIAPSNSFKQKAPGEFGRVQLRFFVASGVSRIIFRRRAFDKLRKTREFEPIHVGCHVFVARDSLSPGGAAAAMKNCRSALLILGEFGLEYRKGTLIL